MFAVVVILTIYPTLLHNLPASHFTILWVKCRESIILCVCCCSSSKSFQSHCVVFELFIMHINSTHLCSRCFLRCVAIFLIYLHCFMIFPSFFWSCSHSIISCKQQNSKLLLVLEGSKIWSPHLKIFCCFHIDSHQKWWNETTTTGCYFSMF